MQTEDGSNATEDHLTSSKFSEKSKPEVDVENATIDESSIKNGNGIHESEKVVSEKQSNGGRAHGSPPIAHSEPVVLQSADITQPLNFELGPDVQGNQASNNFWQMPPQEEQAMFHSFQPNPLNPPQSLPNYSLNNNNSFPQPMPFGSIGQPPSYIPANHGQFSSPPGMHGHNMSMIPGMGPMNSPMGGMNYPNSHNSQNQRRAITAQHNYGSMGGKQMNARFPWSNQQSAWPNNNQPPNVSPWTMALQQQKALNRGGGAGGMAMGPGSKKGQSNMHLNHGPSMGNPMMQHKYGKRNSLAASNNMVNGGPKGAYGNGPSGAETDPGLGYQVGLKLN